MKKYRVVAFCGESASGKDTYQKFICEDSEHFNSIVSTTTRPIREGEVEGVNYFYVDKEKFAEKLLDYSLLEATDFNGWFYGTTIDALSEDKINIGVFNPEGIRRISEDDRVDLITFYVKASPKVRMLRALHRETDPNVDEIVRRYGTDKKDFAELEFPFMTINNEGNDIEKIKVFSKALAQDLLRTKQDNPFFESFIYSMNPPK